MPVPRMSTRILLSQLRTPNTGPSLAFRTAAGCSGAIADTPSPCPAVPQDFSHLPTPMIPGDQDDSPLIARRALPNPRIPAYISGRLAWGAPPSARAAGKQAAADPQDLNM